MEKFMKLIAFALFFLSFSTFAKTVNMNLDLSGSKITIYGDSNIKGWHISAKKFSGTGSFDMDGETLKKVNSFTITLEAAEVKAKSRSMNRKAAKALEVDKFPKITGTIKKSSVKGNTVTGTMEFNLHGIKKSLPFKSTVSFKRGNLIVEGEQNLDMTHFGIKPPVSKIIFITATTRPGLRIEYKLELSK